MGGFGDLFGSLGDLIGGVVEGVQTMEDATRNEGRSAGYEGAPPMERYLVGGPKPLNVNDI
jgi:hypothetical protein